MKKIYTLIILVGSAIADVNAQTCGGEVVKFQETFGAGGAKTSLPTGRTNYIYNGTGSLADGDYVLHRSTQGRPEWHNASDHTGDVNGRMMVTNASYAPGEFYRDTVYGVSSVSTYNIYFYAMNVNTVGTCSPNPILPALQVIVESYNFDGSFTQIYTLNSASLPQTSTPTWVRISGQFYLPTACTAVRYRIINNSTGGCGNDLAIDDITFSQCNPTILPVRGLTLKADDNKLNWYTLSEKNTDKFLVQKSSDNTNWITIGTIKAAGESEVKSSYSFTDKMPQLKNYYRIVSVDYNGEMYYSNLAVVKSESTADEVSIFPNPISDFFNINVKTLLAGNVTVRVLDLNGKLLKTIPASIKSGENLIRVSGLSQFGNGMYFVTVTNSNGNLIAKSNIIKH